MKFGIIGCGAISGVHGDFMNKATGVELAAVYDLVPERTQALATKYGVHAAESLDDLCNHVDAVTVAVPSGLHAETVIECARRGKHVLSEKPIDVSTDAARKAIEFCKTAGVTYGVISQHRFAPDIQRAREAMLGGAFGKPVIGDASIKWYRTQAYYDSGEWRGTWKLDGGCLLNQGVHYIDMLQWTMGGIKSVQAQMLAGVGRNIEAETAAQALVEFHNGAIGTIMGSTLVYPGFEEKLELHGLNGTIVIEGDKIKKWEVDPNAASDPSPYGRGVQYHPVPNLSSEEGEQGATGAGDPLAIFGAQHQLHFEDFASAVGEGRAPFIPAEEALKPLQVILAIYESARQDGKRVLVDSM